MCIRVKSCLRWCYLWIRIIFRCFYRFCRCLWWCWCCCFCRCCCCSRRCRCCSCFCDCNKIVYLLDPEGGDLTKDFARQFKVFVKWSFDFEHVTSLAECYEGYPIALLLRRQTDRAAEDIAAMMTKIPEDDIYDRIALIYFHVVMDKGFLPETATKDRVMEFKDLGIILDFGYERNGVCGGIYSCNFEGKVKSRDAFETFVMNTLGGRIRI